MKYVVWICAVPLVVACSAEPSASSTAQPPGAGQGTGTTPDGTTVPDSGAVTTPTSDAGSPAADASGTPDVSSCTAASEQLLKPIDAVSTGEVTVLSDAAGTKVLFVDAAAGGSQGQATQPRVYVSLETGAKVALTDKSARGSTAWDLSIKRPLLFTNGGDGGGGQGGSVFLAGVDFATVTAASAAGKELTTERFFDAECNPIVDQTGAVKTTFDGWYDYDQASNALSPKAGTWLVKGGGGKLFKVQILSYYATPDGGAGQSGGRYTLQVGAL